MGWSLRKSTSFGLFRLNFSRSGLGLSFGVKGARISVNSRGTYVNLGANGIYYRQRINGNGNASRNNLIPNTPIESVYSEVQHSITTDSIEDVTDKYLNKKGGPDKRFSNNRLLPVCLYTDYKFESDSGIEEVITTSKTGGMDSFIELLITIGEYQRRLN